VANENADSLMPATGEGEGEVRYRVP